MHRDSHLILVQTANLGDDQSAAALTDVSNAATHNQLKCSGNTVVPTVCQHC